LFWSRRRRSGRDAAGNLELGVGEFDELRQRGVGEIAILVVDRLDPGAIKRDQFLAE
jgi:hypothetical protein